MAKKTQTDPKAAELLRAENVRKISESLLAGIRQSRLVEHIKTWKTPPDKNEIASLIDDAVELLKVDASIGAKNPHHIALVRLEYLYSRCLADNDNGAALLTLKEIAKLRGTYGMIPKLKPVDQAPKSPPPATGGKPNPQILKLINSGNKQTG